MLKIMGILNITPDSFSDGGLYNSPSKAIKQLYKLLEQGADVIDIGAESTRPGAILLDTNTEWQRLEPILQEIDRQNIKTIISLDTRKGAIAELALRYSVQIINDVSGLADPKMLKILQQNPKLKIVLNHHRGLPVKPHNASTNPQIIKEISDFWEQKLHYAQSLKPLQIILDPGFGFGKNNQENLLLLKNLAALHQKFAFPFLIGLSRKRFVRKLWSESNQDLGSVSLATLACTQILTEPTNLLYLRCHQPDLHKPLRTLFST
jgi:dihydropteroate synthase